jgi:hypothetical protein
MNAVKAKKEQKEVTKFFKEYKKEILSSLESPLHSYMKQGLLRNRVNYRHSINNDRESIHFLFIRLNEHSYSPFKTQIILIKPRIGTIECPIHLQ